MINEAAQLPSDAPSILGHSSSTAGKKLSQPTQQEEGRNRERKVDDENKRINNEDDAVQLAADKMLSILDIVLGKGKDTSQDTPSM